MEVSEIIKRRAILQAELDSLAEAAASTDPAFHPDRFDAAGHCIDLTGQPSNCERCGAPYTRCGAYLHCTADKAHWSFIDCSEAAQRAIVEHWSNHRPPDGTTDGTTDGLQQDAHNSKQLWLWRIRQELNLKPSDP